MKTSLRLLRASRRADSSALHTPPQSDKLDPAGVVETVPAVLTLNHVVVPIDFSKTSMKALRYAVPLAERFGARITLLNVLEVPPYGPELSFPGIDLDRTRRALEEDLARLKDRAIPGELESAALVRHGVPYDVIVDAAKELAADLIVITTHGHTGVKHMLLGSTAERVVQRAHCPVLVVR